MSHNPYSPTAYNQSYSPQVGAQPAPGMQQHQMQQQAFCPVPSSVPVAVQSPIPPMVPAGLQVQGQPYIPPSQMPRLGDGQVLQNEWYDYLLYGFGQIIRAQEEIFAAAGRQGNPDLTNFSKPGELSNDTQFEICAIWSYTYFDQPEDIVLPDSSDPASKLYNSFASYSRFAIIQQKAEKAVIPMHRIPAGGGVGGFDVNTGANTKSQGSSSSFDLYRFDKNCRYLIPPGKTIKGVLTWMTALPGGSVYPGGYNPLDRFNSNNVAEKCVKFGAVGVEVRDGVNG